MREPAAPALREIAGSFLKIGATAYGGPAIMGVMQAEFQEAVALTRLAPHAVPDLLALAALVASVLALLLWRLAPLKLMLAGSVFGVLRKGELS